MRLLYQFFRLLARLMTAIYYRRRLVLGREHLHIEGPAIVVSNHPSTLSDVFNIGIFVRQTMFFLANYGLFRHPISNWLLSRLYCIPIKRKEDVAEGEVRNNDVYFEQAYRHLERGGLLYIAAEGYSWMNRYVMPFKTGTARIALGAEACNNWTVGVKILPVGLSYNAPHWFRSDVVVHFGAPVEASAWRERYEADEEQAVRDLTETLYGAVKSHCVDARDRRGQGRLARLELLVGRRHRLATSRDYAQSRFFAEKLIGDEALMQKINRLFALLRRARIPYAAFFAAKRAGAQVWQAPFWVIGAPVALLGLAWWFLPCWAPWALKRRLGLYVGYSPVVKMLAGLFTFGAALWAAWRLGAYAGGSAWYGLFAVAFAAVAGLWADAWLEQVRLFALSIKGRRLLRRDPALAQTLSYLYADCLQAIATRSTP